MARLFCLEIVEKYIGHVYIMRYFVDVRDHQRRNIPNKRKILLNYLLALLDSYWENV